MHSSTSSFNRTSRRAESRRCLALFGVILAALCVAGSLTWRAIPLETRRRWVPESFEPVTRSDEYYLSLYRSEAVDHYVHFHRTDPEVNRNLKSADVIFLGTSRMMLGLDNAQLRSFFGKRGLRHYLMGFAYGESVSFARAVMQRSDLRPRWIVINTDGFFYPRPSHYGWEVMHSTRANAAQVQFETEATFAAISTLHRWLPYAGVDRTKSVWLRSRRDGPWQPYFVPQTAKVFEQVRRPGIPLQPEVLREARVFLEECRQRGAHLVFTFVPTPSGSRDQGEELAKVLDLPWVAPVPPGMESYDDSHLTTESASRFTRQFLDGLDSVIKVDGDSGHGSGNRD